MEQLLSRYRSLTLLAVLLFGQLTLLAYQIRRPDSGGLRLIRLWGIAAIVPIESASHKVFSGTGGFFHKYVFLRHVRAENEQLRAQIEQLKLQNTALRDAAADSARFSSLLGFRQSYVGRTVAAQVIGSGSSSESQVIYVNRGERDGLAQNMPVITPDGVVGKISNVFATTAQVLLLTDPDSGVGALLADSRVHGVLIGVHPGLAQLNYVINDEDVPVGAEVITSGEDRIYPKGLPIGRVVSSRPGPELFREIEVRPAVTLSRLEEVLVITNAAALKSVQPSEPARLSAAQIREKQLPSVPSDSVFPKSGEPLAAWQVQAAMAKRRREQQAKAEQLLNASSAPAAKQGPPSAKLAASTPAPAHHSPRLQPLSKVKQQAVSTSNTQTTTPASKPQVTPDTSQSQAVPDTSKPQAPAVSEPQSPATSEPQAAPATEPVTPPPTDSQPPTQP